MVYTNTAPSKLPTIDMVLEFVRDIVDKMPVRHQMPYDRPIEDPLAELI